VRSVLFSCIFPFLISNVSGLSGSVPVSQKSSTLQVVELLSGSDQYARAGSPFPEPIVISLSDSLGKPVSNLGLTLELIEPEGIPFNTQTVRTDSMGIALFHIKAFRKSGEYILMAFCPGESDVQPVFCTLHVRPRNWVFMLLIGLLGGLGLFLLGMSMMSEGMQNSAGSKMRNLLSRLTNNRFVALGLGAFVTMVIQSSSATNVMLVSFVNSKLMRFRQTIGIILGAAIGTTITAQIIAFKLTDYALIFVIVGLALQYFVKSRSTKEIGKAILGFGILFFGMHIMSESMYPLRTYDPFLNILLDFQNPALGILAGAFFTALIQSSSAFIGILIILSMQGLLTLNAAIPLLIGANVGTSITAILASLNASRESKQVALAHTIFKIIGAVIILFFLSSFTKLILLLTGDPISVSSADNVIAQPRQIANAHTIYNIALCILFVPFTETFARFITWIFPSREEPEVAFRLRFIDESLLKTPVIAVDTARMELVRMMKKVYFMTEKIIHPFIDRDTRILKEIERSEEEINYLRDQIMDFLLKVTQNTVAADLTEEAFIMMNAVREFEQIGDIISHQLKDKAESWCRSEYHFSEEGLKELEKYHSHTLTIIIQALKVYENFDLEAARKLRAIYKRYRQEYFDMEQLHYDRLKENVESTHSSSKTHLEIITLLRVISSHATDTSRILIYRTLKERKNKGK
jgi:phosphate:Na+ symporter